MSVLLTVSSMRSRRYPTDLTDAEWSHLATLLPSTKPRSRPLEHPIKEILDADFYDVSEGTLKNCASSIRDRARSGDGAVCCAPRRTSDSIAQYRPWVSDPARSTPL